MGNTSLRGAAEPGPGSPERPSIGRSTILLVGATAVSSALAVFRNFYVARYLLPASFGAWSLVNTLLYYAGYADVGVNAGLILEAPRLIGQGAIAESGRVQRQAFTATLMIGGGAALLVAAATWLSWLGAAEARPYVRIVALAIVVLALMNYYNVIARIRDMFGLISVSVIVMAVTASAGVVAASLAARGLGVGSVALVTTAGYAAAALTLALFARTAPAWPPDWSLALRLVKIGLPVSLLPIGFTLFLSLDRWIVAVLMPGADLGYYGFGALLGMFLYMIPSTLSVVLFTRQIERFGTTNDPRSLEPLVIPPIQLSGFLMAFLAGGVVLSLPVLVQDLLPQYRPGLAASMAQVAANGLLFTVPVGANFLISIGRRKVLFTALAAATAGKAVLVAAVTSLGRSVAAASVGVLAGNAVYAVLIAALVFRFLGESPAAAGRGIAAAVAPFAVCLPVALALAFAVPPGGATGRDLVRWLAIAAAYASACGTGCLLVARRRGLLRQPFVLRRIPAWLPGPWAEALIGRERELHD